MKTRETKKQKKPVVILSEATDGVNKVRLLRAARAEEEEACPWEEIDAYSGRFVVAGWRYDTDDTSNNLHPWLAYSTDGGKTWTKSDTTANANQAHGELYALAYGGGRFVVAGHQTNTSAGDPSNNLHPWLAYSIDGGKTWTPSDTTGDANQVHGQLCALAYGGGRFVVAGFRYTVSNSDDPDTSDNLHPWLAYSIDGGKTWTPSDTTANEEQPHGYLSALAYGGGRFVVAGWRYSDDPDTSDTSDNYHPWLAYSTDGGKTWTPSDTTANEEQPPVWLIRIRGSVTLCPRLSPVGRIGKPRVVIFARVVGVVGVVIPITRRNKASTAVSKGVKISVWLTLIRGSIILCPRLPSIGRVS